MNILDENILNDQRQLLLQWQIHFRQIGYEAGRKGMSDEDIIPFLHGLASPTFFTLDRDFYDRALCHRRYAIVFLDVGQSEAAFFIRRVLRHASFRRQSERLGKVFRVSHTGISFWKMDAHQETPVKWEDK